MHAGDDAKRGELGLAGAGENIDLGLQGALGGTNEGMAVLGIAARGRGDGERFTYPHALAQRAVALERRQRVLDRIRGEKTGGLHLAAQAAQRLFVEEFRRAAREPLVNHKPHGIRADVDDSDRRTVIEATLGVELGALHWQKFASVSGWRIENRASPLCHWPRVLAACPGRLCEFAKVPVRLSTPRAP